VGGFSNKDYDPDTVTSEQTPEPGVDGEKFAFVILPCLMVKHLTNEIGW